MGKRLHYFNISGLGEGIRYLLHYARVEFDDVRYETDGWPAMKNNFPFGQLPVYEEGDRQLNQTFAILRYLGHANNLAGDDAWQDAQLDATALTINDFWGRLSQMSKLQGDEFELAKKTFLGETVDYFFSRFEKHLKDNGGFFSGKLTWVDFMLVGQTEAVSLYMNSIIEAKYPTVQALIAKIHSYPGVKKYVDSRKPYKIPTPN